MIHIVNAGEFVARNDGATPISNRRATSDDVTNFPSIDYIFYNLVGTYTITRILDNYGTAKGIAYFIEDKKPIYSKYPSILYREELDVNYHGSSTKVKAFKEYIYSLEQDKIVKYFVNENNNTLFYQMRFISGSPCQAEAIHQCNLDIYQASYIFLNKDSFDLSYKILGPNKDYTIKTSFIRL
ncbi:MAG TPA: DUF6314 family protein [Rickettsia endosymbiont of Sericostoma sp.]|uniref:DUF6314 family protein n=1 Tax=unclassified Candidatus Tisiphia TaxID=2996318 RepID=UPI001D8E859C|nr:DUF6314 family protein [Rickettsia endosymbiont of Sericostoma sp.]